MTQLLTFLVQPDRQIVMFFVKFKCIYQHITTFHWLILTGSKMLVVFYKSRRDVLYVFKAWSHLVLKYPTLPLCCYLLLPVIVMQMWSQTAHNPYLLIYNEVLFWNKYTNWPFFSTTDEILLAYQFGLFIY